VNAEPNLPPASAKRPEYNHRANSLQINPNKTKQNCLDLLGFIRPNRGFSMGYGESK
jgi:hypothetical protein